MPPCAGVRVFDRARWLSGDSSVLRVPALRVLRVPHGFPALAKREAEYFSPRWWMIGVLTDHYMRAWAAVWDPGFSCCFLCSTKADSEGLNHDTFYFYLRGLGWFAVSQITILCILPEFGCLWWLVCCWPSSDPRAAASPKK